MPRKKKTVPSLGKTVPPSLLSYFTHIIFSSYCYPQLIEQGMLFCHEQARINNQWWQIKGHNLMPFFEVLYHLEKAPWGINDLETEMRLNEILGHSNALSKIDAMFGEAKTAIEQEKKQDSLPNLTQLENHFLEDSSEGDEELKRSLVDFFKFIDEKPEAYKETERQIDFLKNLLSKISQNNFTHDEEITSSSPVDEFFDTTLKQIFDNEFNKRIANEI